MAEIKKLYRSDKDKVFGGIMGGMSEYFEVDSALLRIVALFFIIISGVFPGLLAYLIAVLIVPKKPVAEPAGQHPTEPENKTV